MKDKTPAQQVDGNDQVIVPLSPALKQFLEQQAALEHKTPAQILIAALLRTYNPHSEETDRG